MDNKFSRSGQKPPDALLGIGAAVRQARRAHGLTQTQLAGLAGTGLRFISELERGKPSVALDKTLAVLAVLGLRFQISAAKP
jgi:y4mF family transcriptional regulator